MYQAPLPRDRKHPPYATREDDKTECTIASAGVAADAERGTLLLAS
jgi:hypothetical protein